MQIQINTGHNIEVDEARIAEISGIVESALSRFSDHITRLEVHLSDENSDKKAGHDAIRCMIEARIRAASPLRSRTRHRAWTYPSTAPRIS